MELDCASGDEPTTVVEDAEAGPRQSHRERQPRDYYGEWVSIADVELEEPATVKKALASPDKTKWKIAMEKEFESLRENNVWELVELPQDQTAVGIQGEGWC